MQMFIRIIVGLVGVLAIMLAARFFQNPAAPAAMLGVAPVGELGIATIRGDFGGFFGVCGILAVAAAIRNSAILVAAPLIAVALALTGRIISYAIDGGGAPVLQPMLIEAVLVVVFGLGWATMARS